MRTIKTKDSALRRRARRRGSSLLMALMYVTLFGALAASMTMFTTNTMDVAASNDRSTRSYAAAESGMSWLMLEFRTLQSNRSKGVSPMMPDNQGNGAISTAFARTLFSGTASGNPGLAPALASLINGSVNAKGKTVIWNTSTVQIPPIQLFGSGDTTCFAVTITQDATTPTTLHLVSTGNCSGVLRSVTMDLSISAQLKYAVYSNVAIQLGKNVRIQGDIASTFAGSSKGPPVQMFSDMHYMNDLSSVDSDLGTFRNLLATYDTALANRLDVHSANSAAAALAASKAGLKDLNGDGYIDEYDIMLKAVDTNKNAVVTTGEFTDPYTGKPYDTDLWALIDDPFGHLDASGNLSNGTPKPWLGYDDGQFSNKDAYAKVNGTVKMAINQGQWQADATNWPLWGDGGGTRFQDFFEGPVIPQNPTDTPVQLGYDFSTDLTMKPQNFNTSGIDSQITNATATKVTTGGNVTISNGTLTAAQANGGSVTEHFPSDVSSGWQATYTRPVFTNVTFTNVRIPKGLNAKFINCTFNGYTDVKLNTQIVSPTSSQNTNPDGTTPDPNGGMAWAQKMTSGSFNANTALTSGNSTAFAQGNNLHFAGCTFNGVMGADVPTAYTHFANSWEFDSYTDASSVRHDTAFNNSVDQSQTIVAPNTNIEIGGYTNPGGNPSTLVGVVVAGNIDIRGTANVDGSMIVTGNGATNTTLGYFGSTDSGQAVPPISQLPASAGGSYGHLFFRYNPTRGMPNGITIPITLTVDPTSYAQAAVATWAW